MIIVDNSKCTKCGICLSLRGNYCLNEENEKITINEFLCNYCLKCVSVCPSMVFSFDNNETKRIDKDKIMKSDSLEELLKARKSIRNYSNTSVGRELLKDIVRIGRYAPTMNRDIEAIIIDDKEVMEKIDKVAFKFYNTIYKFFFKNKFIFSLIKLFSDSLGVAKVKLENSIKDRKIVYDAPAMIILIGNKKVILTEISAQYHLYNMMLYAESLGLGTCLMDSVKTAVASKKSLRKLLNIPKKLDVLGVITVGYPKEKIINKASGLTLKYSWNKR